MDKDELQAEITRLAKIAAICHKFGEVDGFTPANAQIRALEQELSALEAGR